MPLTARHDLAHEMKVKECLNEQGCIEKKKKSSQDQEEETSQCLSKYNYLELKLQTPDLN